MEFISKFPFIFYTFDYLKEFAFQQLIISIRSLQLTLPGIDITIFTNTETRLKEEIEKTKIKNVRIE